LAAIPNPKSDDPKVTKIL
jgi:3-hydroxy-3-methylglutaryl CoA synthase